MKIEWQQRNGRGVGAAGVCTLAAALALAACGGGSNSGDVSVNYTNNSSGGTSSGNSGGTALACSSFHTYNATATATVDAGCASCSAADAPKAVDGDTASYATLIVNHAASGMGVSLRATAQAGTTLPAGLTPGAIFDVPAGTAQSYSISLRTYLSGVLQETDLGETSPTTNGVGGGHGASFDGFKTTKAFDAVEILINNNQTESAPAFHVYELCADHGS